jgi:hypothetical protein
MTRIGLLLAFVGIAAGAETFTGVITDTMCGAKHTMMKNQPDEACVKMCAKGSSEFALFDGKNVVKLSDQKSPARFAAQRVRVTGTYDEKSKTIKVGSMEADKGENQ